jgi:hypothetical protein
MPLKTGEEKKHSVKTQVKKKLLLLYEDPCPFPRMGWRLLLALPHFPTATDNLEPPTFSLELAFRIFFVVGNSFTCCGRSELLLPTFFGARFLFSFGFFSMYYGRRSAVVP